MIAWTAMDSPVGRLLLAADDEGLRRIEFEPWREAEIGDDWERRETPLLRATRAQLADYFARRRRRFELPLAPAGTPFQQRVWRALLEVPYGTTCSYSDIARRLGDRRATRAVGAANGRNPLPIVVPCHRVIGADGSLTGFGGGLAVKRFLLRLEGAIEQTELWDGARAVDRRSR